MFSGSRDQKHLEKRNSVSYQGGLLITDGFVAVLLPRWFNDPEKVCGRPFLFVCFCYWFCCCFLGFFFFFGLFVCLFVLGVFACLLVCFIFIGEFS